MKMKYVVIVTILGESYRIEANSLIEAFGKLQPTIIRGKAIVRVEKDGLSAERVFFPRQLRMLMLSDKAKQLWDKRLNNLLS